MKREILPKTTVSDDLIVDFLNKTYRNFLSDSDKQYYYWSDLKYKKDRPYSELLKSWSLIKLHRRGRYNRIRIGKKEFNYYLTASLNRQLYQLDRQLLTHRHKNPITAVEIASFLEDHIRQEVICSAAVAGIVVDEKKMESLWEGRRSLENDNERLVLNQWESLQRLFEEKDAKLSLKLIHELHKNLLKETRFELQAGQFRQIPVRVKQRADREVKHIPPAHEDLRSLFLNLCDFINTEEPFVHPLIKACILHYLICYLHPYEEANGRIARMLMYWFLIKKDYTLFRVLPVSNVIQQTLFHYESALTKVSNDENDLTYFLNYSVEVFHKAFAELIVFRDQQKQKNERGNLMAYKIINKGFYKRQADLIGLFYTGELEKINITEYATKYEVVRQTARKDLNALKKAKLIEERKVGRAIFFRLSSKEAVRRFVDE